MMLGLPALLAVPSDVRRYPTIANHRRYCFKRLQSERIYLSTTSKGQRISSVLWIRRIDCVTPTNCGQERGVPPLDSVPRSGRLGDHVKKRLGACFSTVVYRQMLYPRGLALWARARMAHREATVKGGVKSFPLRAEQKVSMESRRISPVAPRKVMVATRH